MPNDLSNEQAEMDKAADERMYEAYRRERDIEGLSHAQILELGLFPKDDAERYCMRFSLACARYAEAMRNRNRFDSPEFAPDGRRLGNPYFPPIPERKDRQ